MNTESSLMNIDHPQLECAARIKEIAQNPDIVLSHREQQVLNVMSWGPSYKEASFLLRISIHTIDKHLRNIKEKTGLTKVAELSAYFFYKAYSQGITLSLLILITCSEFSENENQMYRPRRGRRQRTEIRCSVRTQAGKGSSR